MGGFDKNAQNITWKREGYNKISRFVLPDFFKKNPKIKKKSHYHFFKWGRGGYIEYHPVSLRERRGFKNTQKVDHSHWFSCQSRTY